MKQLRTLSLGCIIDSINKDLAITDDLLFHHEGNPEIAPLLKKVKNDLKRLV